MSEPTLATEHIATGKEDPERPVTWIVKWTIHEHYAEAKAFEAAYSDERPLVPGLTLVSDVDGEDPIVEVQIRWDGCANWCMSTKGLSLHTCGGNEVQSLAELLVYLHKRAGELIPAAEDPWGD